MYYHHYCRSIRRCRCYTRCLSIATVKRATITVPGVGLRRYLSFPQVSEKYLALIGSRSHLQPNYRLRLTLNLYPVLVSAHGRPGRGHIHCPDLVRPWFWGFFERSITKLPFTVAPSLRLLSLLFLALVLGGVTRRWFGTHLWYIFNIQWRWLMFRFQCLNIFENF